MADSPGSSDLSSPPSVDEYDEQGSTAAQSSRPSVERFHPENEHPSAPASKRRKTGPSHLTLANDRAASSQVNDVTDIDDNISISSDGWSSAPGSPQYDEYSLRDEAQTMCLWRDCDYGEATNNDDLVAHVQSTHCATGGPKKSKYVCEWGECQRKASNHPSGYALKAHMRSHTKEKPYYCALPECDKAFTRSDALAKHMRTVHEPEVPTNASDQPQTGKKSIKLKLSNGNSKHPSTPTLDSTTGAATGSSSNNNKPPYTYVPEFDSEGEEIDPSTANDNITYLPAHHPLTGQPGFMIHYPADIKFTTWENGIPANQLMGLLRRQVHWAEQEQAELKAACEKLERVKREEFNKKELLFETLMESELLRGKQEGLFSTMEAAVVKAMEREVPAIGTMKWSGPKPEWLRQRNDENNGNGDVDMGGMDGSVRTDNADADATGRTPSPPPTGNSGGFEGEGNPYDNYLASTLALYEERKRQRSLQNTPQKAAGATSVPPPLGPQAQQEEAEADAVGALVDMRIAGGNV